MKLLPAVLCATAASLDLGGCAGLPNTKAAPVQEVDYAKVEAIENAARARGVSLYWYRYPTKPAANADTAQQKP